MKANLMLQTVADLFDEKSVELGLYRLWLITLAFLFDYCFSRIVASCPKREAGWAATQGLASRPPANARAEQCHMTSVDLFRHYPSARRVADDEPRELRAVRSTTLDAPPVRTRRRAKVDPGLIGHLISGLVSAINGTPHSEVVGFDNRGGGRLTAG